MPKNTIIPAAGGFVAPPVAEQSMMLAQFSRLNGYFPSATTESDVWTLSFWFKQSSDLAAGGRRLFHAQISGNNFTTMFILADGTVHCEMVIANVKEAEFVTRKLFRDTTNWYHFYLLFNRSAGLFQFFVNGEIYADFTTFNAPTNIPGYSWLDSTAEHVIGADLLGAPLSGMFADWNVVGGSALGTPGFFGFGTFNSSGTWERTEFPGPWGNHGFNLTFGRTVDLGEDFSGNANDFTEATGGTGPEQFDDWTERNYCILDENDPRTTGTITDGGLVVAGGVAAVTMRPDTGVWYYERNGVAVVFDTGVSGQFDPLLDAASYNFGQFAFADVGPGGGELTLSSPNLPASAIADSRDFFAAITYNSNGINPRTIINGSQGLIEHRNLTHRSDLVWLKNANAISDFLQAHRLRAAGAQVKLDIDEVEETVNAQGTITGLDDPGPGFSVDAGGAGDDNVNDNAGGAKFYGVISWHVERFAQNIPSPVITDNGEEEIVTGDTDTTSSDMEFNSESDDAASEQICGMRYNNVLIPQGATILSAHLQCEADEVRISTPCDLEIFCEDADNAATFVDGAANFNISGRPKTSASTLWTNVPGWVAVQDRLAAQLTPDFASSVQDVVDRLGWAAGNSLVVLVEHDQASANFERRTADKQFAAAVPDTREPTLQVTWRETANDSGVSLFDYSGVGKIAQVMHGLGDVPEFVAVKRANGAASSWRLFHSLIQTALPAPEDGYLELDTTAAAVDLASIWNDTAPGGTFLSLGADASVNANGDEYIGMAMRSIPGFSFAFRYVGNGSLDGPQVYCGFKPRMLIIKAADQVSEWIMHQRGGGAGTFASSIMNPMIGEFRLNSTGQAGGLARDVDVYANGFKVRDTNVDVNQNLAEYVGIAFAEAPFENTKAAK